MPNSKQRKSKLADRVKNELQNLNIKEDKNSVELVLAHHEFDFHKTINSFKNGTSEELLDEWKLFTGKKKPKHSRTSTAKTILTTDVSSSINDQPLSSKDVADVSGCFVGNKQSSGIIHDELIGKIDAYEQSIKDYEKKIESCDDIDLRGYYIKSATQQCEHIGLLLQIYKEKMIDRNSKLSSQLNYLLDQDKYRTRNELDCWDNSSNRTRDEQEDFKNKLIMFYECDTVKRKKIKCMVMNKFFDRCFVRAAHIWRVATNGAGLPAFHLEESDVNHERNGLLLFESIEKAFDSKKLCFIYDPFAEVLRLKILCNDLRTLFVVSDDKQRKIFNEFRKFNDIDNAVLILPKDILPFRRLLNWHGRCSYRTAKMKNWITNEENLEDFFQLSDLISLPSDDNDE